MRDECAECKEERKKRILVAENAQDLKISEEKFVRAPAVFANNDVKYEVNKKRALGYANKMKTGVMYCPAKDKPSHEALRIRPDLLRRRSRG